MSISACSSAAGAGRVHALTERIRGDGAPDAPLVLAGDFNDWRSKADTVAAEELGMVEVFSRPVGRPARTFRRCCRSSGSTAFTPRAWTSSIPTVHLRVPLARLSDHAALGSHIRSRAQSRARHR
jgi:endonuclease/exonuclease/phosphatase family metal-dependent hydrolase